jgi:hypothetical protein
MGRTLPLVAAKKRDSNLKVASPHIGLLDPLIRAHTAIIALTRLELQSKLLVRQKFYVLAVLMPCP